MTLDTFFDILKNQATTAEERDQLDAQQAQIIAYAQEQAEKKANPFGFKPVQINNPFKLPKEEEE